MNRTKTLLLTMLLGITLLAAGCGGFDDGDGDLALSIADAPVSNVAEVNVTLDEVQVHSAENGWFTVNDFADEEDGTFKVDLLTLRFDEELLGEELLPAGNYTQIRLIVAADETPEDDEGFHPANTGQSYIVYEDDTQNKNLFIPSGTQTGLKINHNFTIEEGSITQLLLDVDVRKMMHEAGDRIILRPTAIDIIDQVVSGGIEGKVDADYETIKGNGQDILVEVEEVDKATVALLEDQDEEEYDNPRDAGSYRIRGLEEGTYTLEAKIVDGDGAPVDDKVDTTEVTVEAEEVNYADDLEL